MWLSALAFRNGLYAEHCDELDFLYHQTQRLREDEVAGLTTVVGFEHRLVAHLDALVQGGADADAVLQARHDDDESGHWYARTFLACARRNRVDLQRVLEHAVASGTEAAAQGVADALRHGLPQDWSPQLTTWLPAVPEPLRGWLADVAVHLPGIDAQPFEAALASCANPSARLLGCMGRVGARGAGRRLAEIAAGPLDNDRRAAALHSLLALDVSTAFALVRRFIDHPALSHRALGVAAGPAEANALLRRLHLAQVDSVLALGMLGELAAVRPLVGLLDHAELGAAAATALQWITGAALEETVVEAQDNEWSDETESYPRLGVAARTLPKVQRISRDQAAWQAWLTEAAPQFQAGRRYRFGRPCSARVSVDAFAEHAHGPLYRAWASDELRLRHGSPATPDSRAALGQQRAAVKRLQAWALAVEASKVDAA
jgi:hypothetical protein